MSPGIVPLELRKFSYLRVNMKFIKLFQEGLLFYINEDNQPEKQLIHRLKA